VENFYLRRAPMGGKVSEVQPVLEVIGEQIEELENLRVGRQKEEL